MLSVNINGKWWAYRDSMHRYYWFTQKEKHKILIKSNLFSLPCSSRCHATIEWRISYIIWNHNELMLFYIVRNEPTIETRRNQVYFTCMPQCHRMCDRILYVHNNDSKIWKGTQIWQMGVKYDGWNASIKIIKSIWIYEKWKMFDYISSGFFFSNKINSLLLKKGVGWISWNLLAVTKLENFQQQSKIHFWKDDRLDIKAFIENHHYYLCSFDDGTANWSISLHFDSFRKAQ